MAIVKKYPVIVTEVNCGEGETYTLKLKSLTTPFKFLPGQFLHLALDDFDAGMGWPESRCFSIQSHPGDEFLKLTYTVKGTFTRRMASEIFPGKKMMVKMPYGDLFSQSHNFNNTVFISGGTGITPYLSLFTDPSFRSYQQPTLFAGFRNEKSNLYTAEISLGRIINAGFNVFYYYEDRDGRIPPEDIFRQQKPSSSFFISGPPAMLHDIRKALVNLGIPANQIKTDDWE